MTLLLLSLSLLQEAADKAVLAEADGLYGRKRYADALGKYEDCLKRLPEWNTPLFNGGLAAYLAGKPARAAELWERLRKLCPEDRPVLAKLVQAYQATGETAKRDAARKALFDLRAKLPEEDRKKFARYCRDQFPSPGGRVLVFEYFELAGERPLVYRFSVMNEDENKELYSVSLGSYEITTQIAREQGTIGKDERMFHLDGYFDGGTGHVLYGMFPKAAPAYDDCRRKVEEILKRRAEKK